MSPLHLDVPLHLYCMTPCTPDDDDDDAAAAAAAARCLLRPSFFLRLSKPLSLSLSLSKSSCDRFLCDLAAAGGAGAGADAAIGFFASWDCVCFLWEDEEDFALLLLLLVLLLTCAAAVCECCLSRPWDAPPLVAPEGSGRAWGGRCPCPCPRCRSTTKGRSCSPCCTISASMAFILAGRSPCPSTSPVNS